jgi:hypothetical protein
VVILITPRLAFIAALGTLRAARHLHLVDIDEVVRGGQRVVRVAHPVDRDAHARILRFGLAELAHATDRDAHRALIADVPSDVGGAPRERAKVVGTETLEFLARHHRLGNRFVLEKRQAIA